MSSRWWPSAISRRAELGRHLVEHAAAQPRAQAAHRLAFGHQPLDDRVGVLLDDAELDAARRQVGRQHVRRKAGLLLVEVDGDDLERRTAPARAARSGCRAASSCPCRPRRRPSRGRRRRSSRSRRSPGRPGGAAACASLAISTEAFGSSGAGLPRKWAREDTISTMRGCTPMSTRTVYRRPSPSGSARRSTAPAAGCRSALHGDGALRAGPRLLRERPAHRRPHARRRQRLRHRARALAPVRAHPGAPGRRSAGGERQRRASGNSAPARARWRPSCSMRWATAFAAIRSSSCRRRCASGSARRHAAHGDVVRWLDAWPDGDVGRGDRQRGARRDAGRPASTSMARAGSSAASLAPAGRSPMARCSPGPTGRPPSGRPFDAGFAAGSDHRDACPGRGFRRQPGRTAAARRRLLRRLRLSRGRVLPPAAHRRHADVPPRAPRRQPSRCSTSARRTSPPTSISPASRWRPRTPASTSPATPRRPASSSTAASASCSRRRRLRERSDAQKLLNEHEMGELFKVIALRQGCRLRADRLCRRRPPASAVAAKPAHAMIRWLAVVFLALVVFSAIGPWLEKIGLGVCRATCAFDSPAAPGSSRSRAAC